jgi:class 3 adenylate cyclase
VIPRGGALERLARIGVAADDDERVRLRKGSITLLSTLVVVLTPIWIVTYLALDRPLAAAIPAGYVVVSLALMLHLALTKRDWLFLTGHIVLFLVLPVLLQWTLGGFVHGSAVILWAFSSPVTALVSWGRRGASLAFLAYAAAILVSVLAEPMLRAVVPALPMPVSTAFWALNVIAPSTGAFLLLVYVLRQRDVATARSEELLLNVLPASVARRLKEGRREVADRVPAASVLFVDIVNFTPLAERTSPERVVDLLGRVFAALDDLAERHGLEKIKTLGDGYLAVAGLPEPRDDHPLAAARMALDIGPSLGAALASAWPELEVRVGIASGPVVAGVIGSRRFSYDLWGDTVNTASRMASLATPGTIRVTAETAALLGNAAEVEDCGTTEVKGKGLMETCRLVALLAG